MDIYFDVPVDVLIEAIWRLALRFTKRDTQQVSTESSNECTLVKTNTTGTAAAPNKEDIPSDIQPVLEEAFIIHPNSNEKIPLGFAIETTIRHKEDHTSSNHEVKDVKPKSLAAECLLKNGMELCFINHLRTDGMTNEMIIGLFQAIEIHERTQLIFTIKQVYQNRYGKTEEAENNLTIQFSISHNDISVKSCEESPYRREKNIEASKTHGKLYTEEICWIKHGKTENYLCVDQNGHLILDPLGINISAYIFKRQMFNGIDKDKLSRFFNNPVVVFAFKDTIKKKTDFIVGTAGTEVGLMPLPNLSQTLSVLNDHDPRFFHYIESDNGNTYFMSVQFRDHYLGYNKDSGFGLVCIIVPKSTEMCTCLDKYDDIKFNITYQGETSDIPSNSVTITTL